MCSYYQNMTKNDWESHQSHIRMWCKHYCEKQFSSNLFFFNKLSQWDHVFPFSVKLLWLQGCLVWLHRTITGCWIFFLSMPKLHFLLFNLCRNYLTNVSCCLEMPVYCMFSPCIRSALQPAGLKKKKNRAGRKLMAADWGCHSRSLIQIIT